MSFLHPNMMACYLSYLGDGWPESVGPKRHKARSRDQARAAHRKRKSAEPGEKLNCISKMVVVVVAVNSSAISDLPTSGFLLCKTRNSQILQADRFQAWMCLSPQVYGD